MLHNAPISGVDISESRSPYLIFVKGSPELVLELCHACQQGEKPISLGLEQRQQILRTNEQMAGRGLRVLGFAYRAINNLTEAETETSAEQQLVWLGLAGMLDAPRLEVRDSVKTCRSAGNSSRDDHRRSSINRKSHCARSGYCQGW